VVSATGSGAQSGFLSGWTGGNGADVVSSGVLSNGVSLVGGAAYGSGNLAESLYQKASASVGNGSEVKLSYSQGIEGKYLLSTSNAKLAAMLGNGVSVVSTSDGKVVKPGQGAPGGYGGGGGGASAGGGSKGGGAVDAGGVVDGAPSGNYNNAGNSGAAGNSGNGAIVTTPPVGGQAGGAIVELPIPAQNHGNGGNGGGGGSAGGDLGQDLPVTLPATPAAVVPEPSSIALMMAGVLGALGVARRRKH
jgi:hypothetical protein